MTKPNLLRAGWTQVKEYAPAVMAAALMYGGIREIFEGILYVIANLTMKGLNAVFLRAFRDVLPLPNQFAGVPWQFHAKLAAEGVIVAVLGMFLGLWVNARAQRHPVP